MSKFPDPLPIGTVVCDGQKIVEVLQVDKSDPDMPYQYLLDDHDRVWLEAHNWCSTCQGPKDKSCPH